MSFFDSRPLKPESAEDKTLAETPNGMRVLLNRYAREHSIPNHVFNFAHHEGLSGEDKYTMLAYYALLQLEHYEKIVLDHVAVSPSPTVFLMPIDLTADRRDAARYRFLRQRGNAIVYAVDRNAWGAGASGHIRYDTAEELDTAVDAAIVRKS